jgi:hypothetical protein
MMIRYHCTAMQLSHYIIVCRKHLIIIEFHTGKYVKEVWGSASFLYDFYHIENTGIVVLLPP